MKVVPASYQFYSRLLNTRTLMENQAVGVHLALTFKLITHLNHAAE